MYLFFINLRQIFKSSPDLTCSCPQNTFHEKVTIKEDIRYLCSIHYFTDCGTRDIENVIQLRNGKNLNTRITWSKARENTSTASLDGNDRREQICFKHTLLTLIGTVIM